MKEAQDAEAAEPSAGGGEASVPVHLLLDDDGRHVGRRRHLRHRHRLQTLHHRAAVQPPGKHACEETEEKLSNSWVGDLNLLW